MSETGGAWKSAMIGTFGRFVFFLSLATLALLPVTAQNQYEKRRISRVEIDAGTGANPQLIDQFRLMIRDALGPVYSTPRIRDAIEALYQTRRIDTISVAAVLDRAGDVELNFLIKRKTEAQRVSVVVGPSDGDTVQEEDLLFKLNLVTPGTPVTEQTLRDNADQILDYLRERGFYRSEVTFERRPLQTENDVGVTFRVAPRAQARVGEFVINIEGYQKPWLTETFDLRKGGLYSRERLQKDLRRIRERLRSDNFVAPRLDEPRIAYDGETNTISVAVNGTVGPAVEIVVDSKGEKVGTGTQRELLPVLREGTLDFAAIVEGERRLENHFQERGYFFANITPVCSVTPQLSDTENVPIANETEFLCSFLGGEELMGRSVRITYRADLDRKLRLTDIRIRGTDKLPIDEIKPILGSQEASAWGIIPFLGYGRGYTSNARLDEDAATVRSLMAELGYRDAVVFVNQGVSPNGEDLIITFMVEEGPPSVVSDVTIAGNAAIAAADLAAQLPVLTGRNFSRARMRNAARKLSEYYSARGHFDARIVPSIIEPAMPPNADRRDVKIEFRVENEGRPVTVNRILVNGNESTERAAIIKALAVKPGELLRSADIYTSEQNLYNSDAFSRVEIRTQPAGDAPGGGQLRDVTVNVEEQPPRLMSYGGGYSTDLGLSGFFDIRHVNLFGNLWQGGARVRASQRQQIVQFDLFNPRFLRDGNKRYAPLSLTLQYQRDSTVTRFFRSAFDRGTFGIVQRVDPNGNAIDEFGRSAGSPTLNRFAFFAETNRTISREARSIAYFRYRYEDVRLFNIESLLIKDLLRPDRKTRISGFSTTFVRDTRRNCSRLTSVLELIAKGDPPDECRYSASDPTNGYYLTADYNVSVPALGANVGFQKVQTSAIYFYTFPGLKNTTIAARGVLGAGAVFAGGDRFTNAQFPSLNGLLPISERFFAGGSTNLRGFDLEEAGPRVVIVPQGTFRNSQGETVVLDPFTIPFGGNALAVVNLEARIPLSRSLRAVPFYDGGNVFRWPGEIFRPSTAAPNDVVARNQRAVWTNTLGLGFRLKTPFGSEIGFDYGHLLNPPVFLVPQQSGPNALYRLRPDHIHFRFSQAF
jgi:outer membrane protein insertion porin family